MSRTLNKVLLIGNVGKSPEMKHTPGGIPVTSFRLATSENWKDRDGRIQERTDWHTIIAWRGLAEVITKLVRKGSRIFIEGRLRTHTVDDKNGSKRYVVEILADNMLLLDQGRHRDSEMRCDSPDDLAEFEAEHDLINDLDDYENIPNREEERNEPGDVIF